MISVTRLNRAELILNSDLIEYIEATPDTVLTLTTGQKIVVLEPASEVVNRVIRFRRSVVSGASLEGAPPITEGGLPRTA
jgi:flagellar protein FlbD